MIEKTNTYSTSSPEETELIGENLAKEIAKLTHASPNFELSRFIAMYGDLGAGKTAFVRGMAKILAESSRVCSPTYTIVNEYTSGKIPLYHFDMYRITSDDDLYSCGFYDYLDTDGICICEWSENIPFALPEKYLKITITKNTENENMRTVTVEPVL